jgi:hypothetical protein
VLVVCCEDLFCNDDGGSTGQCYADGGASGGSSGGSSSGSVAGDAGVCKEAGDPCPGGFCCPADAGVCRFNDAGVCVIVPSFTCALPTTKGTCQ